MPEDGFDWAAEAAGSEVVTDDDFAELMLDLSRARSQRDADEQVLQDAEANFIRLKAGRPLSDPDVAKAFAAASAAERKLERTEKDLTRLEGAVVGAKRTLATRKPTTPPRPTGTVPKGYKRVYDPEQGWVDVPTGIEESGDRQLGNRILRKQSDGSYDVVYEAPASSSTSYSPSSMMQAEEQRESGRFERETKFPFEQDKWQQGQDNWKLDFAEKQKQRDLDEAWRAAQRADASQRDAVNLFGTTAQSFSQNLPYAAIPGQSHFLGFEPGGVWEGVAKSRGVPFDPERFRAPIQQYDRDEWWRQAQAMRE